MRVYRSLGLLVSPRCACLSVFPAYRPACRYFKYMKLMIWLFTMMSLLTLPNLLLCVLGREVCLLEIIFSVCVCVRSTATSV